MALGDTFNITRFFGYFKEQKNKSFMLECILSRKLLSKAIYQLDETHNYLLYFILITYCVTTY